MPLCSNRLASCEHALGSLIRSTGDFNAAKQSSLGPVAQQDTKMSTSDAPIEPLGYALGTSTWRTQLRPRGMTNLLRFTGSP